MTMTTAKITSVGVAGTGIMGTGITEVAAKAGFGVVLRSRSKGNVDKARQQLERSLAKQVEREAMSAADRDDILGRVEVTTDLDALAGCGLVLESVVEDLDVKRQLFAELGRICPDAILATNTSTLPVVDVAMATERPDRVLGLHFFNPAPKMPLVEVVPALTTSDSSVEAARRFAEECGKDPVTVKDNAGFIVNALLFPYLNSAVRMLDSGIASREDIDAAMKGGCGFPMGPLALLDLIGLDTSLAILNALNEDRHDGCSAPAPLLKRMVTANLLGRKTGRGFYDYSTKR
ncbi:MAG: 3-hydroxyacyl-CoA dehydrogenase family protein [Acidimicrobiales bacterium]